MHQHCRDSISVVNAMDGAINAERGGTEEQETPSAHIKVGSCTNTFLKEETPNSKKKTKSTNERLKDHERGIGGQAVRKPGKGKSKVTVIKERKGLHLKTINILNSEHCKGNGQRTLR